MCLSKLWWAKKLYLSVLLTDSTTKTIVIMSIYRYNYGMTFLDLLADKKITVYSLSCKSGVPKTTLTDIASGKTDILACSPC